MPKRTTENASKNDLSLTVTAAAALLVRLRDRHNKASR